MPWYNRTVWFLLDKHHPNSLISIDDFDFIRKDRTDMQNKTGGGVLLYYRHSINLKRRTDLEVSQIESIWVAVTLISNLFSLSIP